MDLLDGTLNSATAHCSIVIRENFNRTFPRRWGGHILWPARSPYLNSLNYVLKVFASSPKALVCGPTFIQAFFASFGTHYFLTNCIWQRIYIFCHKWRRCRIKSCRHGQLKGITRRHYELIPPSAALSSHLQFDTNQWYFPKLRHGILSLRLLLYFETLPTNRVFSWSQASYWWLIRARWRLATSGCLSKYYR